MTLRSNVHRLGNFAWALGVFFAVSGCDDAEAPRRATNETAVAKADEKPTEWLDHKSSLSPAEWLVRRRDEGAGAQFEARVQSVEKDLSRAHTIFRESQRMIANRAVQLEGMLRELGAEEDAANILADIMSIPGEVGQTEGFGAVTQHYYILRSNKTDRAQALAMLKNRYGPRVTNP